MVFLFKSIYMKYIFIFHITSFNSITYITINKALTIRGKISTNSFKYHSFRFFDLENQMVL